MMLHALLAWISILGSVSAPDPTPAPVVFTLSLGVNDAPTPSLPTLRYADDDAVRYAELFTALGFEARALVASDENTARLHTETSARAALPTRAGLVEAVRSIAQSVAAARAHGKQTAFIFTYAGHGDHRDGQTVLTLADGVITGAALAHEVIDAVGADTAHVIIDACGAYDLAYGRGPGGTRRPFAGFAGTGELAMRDHAGLLLSASVENETHEWSQLQAGVFSHEVRSGLYGAADADLDGRITYAELAAFVGGANSTIANERFRPKLFARPPVSTAVLADLGAGLAHRIEIPAALAGRYYVEDLEGVRLLDFHSAPGQPVRLVAPHAHSPWFVRAVEARREYVVDAHQDSVVLDSSHAKPFAVESRGAAHEAFRRLFESPFGAATVADTALEADLAHGLELQRTREDAARHAAARAWTVAGVASTAGVVALGAYAWSAKLRRDIRPDDSQRYVSSTNASIRRANVLAGASLAISGVAAAVTAWLWPARDAEATGLPGVWVGDSAVSVAVPF